MASFTAKDVAALREKTNAGMMDCKKALTEADGDMDKAIDFLREKGLAAQAKKSGRIAAEGVVLTYTDEERNVSVVVEVNSETDFVAKNDTFRALVLGVAKTVAEQNPASVEELQNMQMSGKNETVAAAFQEAVLAIGENMKIRRFERVEGPAATYVHGGGSVGVIVTFDTDAATAATAEFKEMGKDVAMQVAAMSPQYLDPAAVPADVLAHEKGIMVAQMKEDPKMANKPEAVLEKIVTGKIGKFYKEVCLLDQQYVKDGDMDVKGYVASVAKKLGADIKVTGFIRYAKGEGLQKKEENFADEIAKMVK